MDQLEIARQTSRDTVWMLTRTAAMQTKISVLTFRAPCHKGLAPIFKIALQWNSNRGRLSAGNCAMLTMRLNVPFSRPVFGIGDRHPCLTRPRNTDN